MSSAVDEIKAQISTKEAEMRRIEDELTVLRKALTILSGRRVFVSNVASPEPKIPDLIRKVLCESSKNVLSNDELVPQVKARGSQATRETILGSAYRLAKDPNGPIRIVAKGQFSLSEFSGTYTLPNAEEINDTGGVSR